jgi:4-hydroxybenzoate polyprenyltransferase
VRLARATIRIIRPYSSLLAFLSILVPLLARSGNLSLSLQKAIPLLFASMCTFIVNDLDDIEKDKINHPERPLPAGELKPVLAVVLYFACLGAALFTIRFFVGTNHLSFLYYTLLVTCISYGYVVEYLGGIKPLYVAGTSSIPILVIVYLYPRESLLYRVAVANFFFMLGRELCKDLLDRPGDPVSFLHKFEPRRLATFAFASQLAGLFLLLLQVEDLLGFVNIVLMAVVFALACLYWFRWQRPMLATQLMKGILFLGLYFLI